MRRIALIALMGLVAGCCDKPQRVNWSDDCERNYSFDSYELDVCKKRVADRTQFKDLSGQVHVDPYDVNRPDYVELGKGHERENN